MTTPRISPDQTTLMIKPVGAICNLRCTYCYYLPTMDMWGGRERRMSEQTLETIFADTLPRWGEEVTIAWQGGEPMLAGVDFFKRALELQQRYTRTGQRVNNAIQTNGSLIDDRWCEFLRQNEFLVGLSLDGPAHLHDHYRIDVQGHPSSAGAHRSLDLMRKHGVEFNVLCVLNNRNVEHVDQVLGFFINRGVRWLQFIPAVEWMEDDGGARPRLAPFSPTGEQYGRFLCRLFDSWFERHRASISVRLFDTVLNKLVLGQTPMCILAGACHHQLTIEHDGSVFGCDHYVNDRWRLGVADQPGWFDRLDTSRLAEFASRKQSLPESCRSCRYFQLCFGGCPKHRPHRGDVPEPTQLCDGYRMFFGHALDRLQWLAGYLRRGQQPPPPTPRLVGVSRNSPCPCGSGRKFKHCHGKAAPSPAPRRA